MTEKENAKMETDMEQEKNEEVKPEEEKDTSGAEAAEKPDKTGDEKPAQESEKAENSEPEENGEKAENTAGQESSKEKERKFVGKKKEKKDKKDEKIEELTDKLARQMAEFDNYRKRTEKEKASMYLVGARDVVEKILPVVDNFERGLTAAKDAEDPFVDGMNKIYKQLTTVLSDMGVTAIESVGKEFDPNLHNAVMHVEDDSVGENIIVEEFQKGYKYKDSVVRHSMVKVAN